MIFNSNTIIARSEPIAPVESTVASGDGGGDDAMNGEGGDMYFHGPFEQYNAPIQYGTWLGGFTHPGSAPHCGMMHDRAYPITMEDSICRGHDDAPIFNSPSDPYALQAAFGPYNYADREYRRKFESDGQFGFNIGTVGYGLLGVKEFLTPEKRVVERPVPKLSPKLTINPLQGQVPPSSQVAEALPSVKDSQWRRRLSVQRQQLLPRTVAQPPPPKVFMK